ncbi:hypothetical protein SAMN05192558_110116 [Actinokineospora alba]|uniref:Uncharacterized protein n=1 Tax=Actinokineospora alba TaxID=504798 RepID=A0A1H0TPI7_9PSEU|nr:hypothetical protein C8E96_6266 [Actinokineospora alba]SDJ12407.1 hypothetical protein SAMN05421871_110116 [Actinokineospora alba]SDP55972.1 hypothetical protein SAMN05192558_110116 [Actinokineospora alba]
MSAAHSDRRWNRRYTRRMASVVSRATEYAAVSADGCVGVGHLVRGLLSADAAAESRATTSARITC